MRSRFSVVEVYDVIDYVRANAEPLVDNAVMSYGVTEIPDEVSFFSHISSFDVVVKDGMYLVQPDIWVGRRCLFPADLSSIPQGILDEDYILVTRRRGDLSVDRIVADPASTVGLIRCGDIGDVISTITGAGYIMLEPRVIDPSTANSVRGIFTLVDRLSVF